MLQSQRTFFYICANQNTTMKTYPIEIIETSTKKVEIDANSLAEAMDIAGYLYKREEIVLDNSDHNRTDIDIITEKQHEDDKNLKEFLKRKLKENMEFLSFEDLAKIAFGSVANALIEYEKKNS